MQKPPAGRQASFDSAKTTSMRRGICNFLAASMLGGVAEAGSTAAISSSAARIATTAILVVAIASPLCLCLCLCVFFPGRFLLLACKGSVPPMLLIGDGDGERSLLGRRGVNKMKIILIIAYINHVFNMFYPIEFNMF